MAKEITLREANQHFAQYVKQVEMGGSFVITRHGEAVARLVPVTGARQLSAAQKAARRRALARMRRGWDLGGAKIDRELLHER